MFIQSYKFEPISELSHISMSRTQQGLSTRNQLTSFLELITLNTTGMERHLNLANRMVGGYVPLQIRTSFITY